MTRTNAHFFSETHGRGSCRTSPHTRQCHPERRPAAGLISAWFGSAAEEPGWCPVMIAVSANQPYNGVLEEPTVEVLLQNERAMLSRDLCLAFPGNDLLLCLEALTVEYTEGGKQSATRIELPQLEIVRRPLDAVMRASSGPLELVAVWHLPERRSHVNFGLSLQSRSAGPLQLASLTAELRIDVATGQTFSPAQISWFRNGWQSWSFSGLVFADHINIPAPRLPFAYGIKEDPGVPMNLAARTSDLVTAVKLGDNAVLAGATEQRFFQRIHIDPGPPQVRLSLEIDLDGQALAPGAALPAGGWQFEGARTATQLVHHWGQRHACRSHRPALTGWCSWYDRYRQIDSDYILSTTRTLASKPHFQELAAVIVDDGYQEHVGDWLKPSPRFGMPISDLGKAIAALGKVPGIWTAPFIVQGRSRVMAEHPHWLLHRGGRPLRIGWNPHWRDAFYALNVGHPEVLAHLADTFSKLYADGFRIFKLDYLFAGALQGDTRYLSIGRFEAFADALDAIRTATGPDAFLMGCGCPLAPAMGRLDAMRVSTDTSYSWLAPRLLRWVTGDSELTGIYPALRNSLVRASFAGHFWQIDPDCVLLRKRRGVDAASGNEARMAAAFAGHLGETLLLGDDLGKWTSREELLLAQLLQFRGTRFWPLDSLDADPPAWGIFEHRGDTFAAVYNGGEARQMFSLALPRFVDRMDVGAATPVTGQQVEVNADRVSIRDVARHTHAVIQVSSRNEEGASGAPDSSDQEAH